MPINYLYPPGSIARGHVEEIGKNDYLAVVKVFKSESDTFEMSAVDPVHAKEKAEMLCKNLGLYLASFTVDEKTMEAFRNINSYERIAGQQVRPEFYQRQRIAV